MPSQARVMVIKTLVKTDSHIYVRVMHIAEYSISVHEGGSMVMTAAASPSVSNPSPHTPSKRIIFPFFFNIHSKSTFGLAVHLKKVHQYIVFML